MKEIGDYNLKKKNSFIYLGYCVYEINTNTIKLKIELTTEVEDFFAN